MIREETQNQVRETGLPWIPRCPAHWSLRRMKYLVDERVEKGYPDEPLLTATQSRGVIPKADYGSRTVEAQKDLHLLKLVEPGDYVISLRSFQGGIEFAHVRGIISPAYTVLEPKPDVRRGYYEHFFKSADFINSMTLFVTGIREGQNIDYVRLSRAYMPVPPPEEQDAIGRFIRHLDHRVNRLIKTKRRLIELLTEQKQAIIHRAVTRGLDPNVPLKPSGIDWLGDVNASWQVLRSKYLFKEVDERSIDGAEEHLSMSQVHGLIPSSKISEKRLVSESYAGGKICREGDLVLNRLKAHLGVFALAPMLGVISPDYTVLRPIADVEERFFELVYRTPACRVELAKRAKGIVQGFWRLYTDDFYCIGVPVPPRAEQKRILDWLDAELKTLNDAIQKSFAEIDLIREYRTRLVADVVTGQLDVRHLDLPDPEAETFADADVADETDEDPETLEPELAEA